MEWYREVGAIMNSSEPDRNQRLLDLRSGGWAILGGVLICIVFFSVFFYKAISNQGTAVGDKRNPETYGFDFAHSVIPIQQIVAAGMPKDGLETIDNPTVITPPDVLKINESERGKYLVTSDRVIGVVIGGKARAYPLRVLNWHEIVNDSLGGRDIAVTYNPLCDSAVVFDRAVNGEVLDFGVSGLLYNSNLLMYDRRPQGEGESLWSQLLFKAVTGPAAGQELDVIPFTLVSWEEWQKQHPDTDVIAPKEAYKKRYKSDPYNSYFSTESIKFSAEPLPSEDSVPLKTPVVVLGSRELQKAFTYSAIASAGFPADLNSNNFQTEVDRIPFSLIHNQNPSFVDVQINATAEDAVVAYSFWFAWYAMHPDTELVR